MRLENIIKNFKERIPMVKKLDNIIRYFTRKNMTQEKKEVPGIYSFIETDSYKKPGIDKKLTKEGLLKYGGPSHVKAYEEITGIKLDEE